MARVKELAFSKGVYLVNSINPFRLEGQKTIMYRILDYFEWNVPDFIIFPGGNLGNTSAFGKAFMELYSWGWIKKIPRMIVAVAKGANTLYKLHNEMGLKWNKGKVDKEIIKEYYSELHKKNLRPNTKASAIQILRPINLMKALRTLEFTDGTVVEVGDQEMLDAMATVNRNGFGCELASAATVAGAKKLVEEEFIKEDETIVGILTGHMLKDPETIIKYHYDSKNRFANTPIVIENDIDSIIKAIE